VVRDEYGKIFRDTYHMHFGHGLACTQRGNAWRLYQYEWVAQAENEASAHVAMGRLEQWLHEHPFLIKRPVGPDLHFQVGFAYSFGADFDAAWKGVMDDRHYGPVLAGPVLSLPDGSTYTTPITPVEFDIPLSHPVGEEREKRNAHRLYVDGPPREWRIQQADGSEETFGPEDWEEHIRRQRPGEEASRVWVVPWRATEVVAVM